MHKMTLRYKDNTFIVHVSYLAVASQQLLRAQLKLKGKQKGNQNGKWKEESDWTALEIINHSPKVETLLAVLKQGTLYQAFRQMLCIGKVFSLFAIQNICCVYLKDNSFERPKTYSVLNDE